LCAPQAAKLEEANLPAIVAGDKAATTTGDDTAKASTTTGDDAAKAVATQVS
jgi:hypothetical protein